MKRTLHLRLAGWSAVWLALAAVASAADVTKPFDVKTTRPTRGEIIRFVTLPGSIKANQQATLYAKVAGYLKSLNVDKGDRVAAGQALGEIEVPELAAEVVRYRADVKVAGTDYERRSAAQKKASDIV